MKKFLFPVSCFLLPASCFRSLRLSIFRFAGIILLGMYGTSMNAQSLSLSLVSSNYNGYNISCFGGRDGAINLTVSGGQPPYTYEWSDGNGTEDLIDIAAGYYQVLVTDAANNSAEIGITLTEPEALAVDFIISSYPNGYNVSCYNCFNGSIINLPSGGIAPYTYSWEDGPTTQDRYNLGKGTYAVQITDANQCLLSPEQYYLFEPERSDWTMNGNAGSNPNTHFIGTTDNKDVVFKTNGTERLRLNANGDIKLSGMTGGGNRALYADNNGIIQAAPCFSWSQCGNTITSNHYLGTNNPYDLKFKVNAPVYPDPVMTLKVGGNVGIGTETPYEKLEVHHLTSAGTTGGINIVNTFFGNKNNEIKFSSLLSLNPMWAIGNDRGQSGQQNFYIYDYVSGKSRLLIDEYGNVGVDTETPSEKLEIAHNDAGGGIAINRINTSNIAKSELKFLHNGVSQFAFGTDLGNDGGHNLFVWDHLAASGAGASRLFIDEEGRVGIGTIPPTIWDDPTIPYKLYVEDGIATRDVKVQAAGWPDYVFEKQYKLISIPELEKYIRKQYHLPGLPSAKEVSANEGFELGEMQILLLEKVEEQALYIISLQSQINELKELVMSSKK